jgi:hypothetical protein
MNREFTRHVRKDMTGFLLEYLWKINESVHYVAEPENK